MKISRLPILVVVSLLVVGSLFAQTEQEQAIEDVLRERTELLNVAKSGPYMSKLVKLHTPDYVNRRTVYLPDGTVQTSEVSFDQFKRILSNYGDSDTHTYKTKLMNIPFMKVFDRSAVAIYTTSYELLNSNTGEVLYGSEQIITADMKYSPDGWKVARMHVTEIRDKINKYPCAYELYQKDENELLVNVKVPNGSSFAHKYIDINFSEVDPNVYMVTTSYGDEFSWEGGVLRVLTSNTDSSYAARPNSKNAVCKELIMYYHNDSCTDALFEK